MTNNILYLVPLLGVVGLIVMAIKSAWVSKQDAGDENMQRLAGYIAKGAMAFFESRMESIELLRSDCWYFVGMVRYFQRKC